MGARNTVFLGCFLVYSVLMLVPLGAIAGENSATPWSGSVQLVLDETQPLTFPRGDRLPLYLWPAMNPGKLDDEQAETLVQLLDKRGIGLICSWKPQQFEACLEECLPVARAQKKLGLPINVNATRLLYSFFDGSEETAHIDDDGQPFFDDGFGKEHMGCPFRLEHRIAPMRERVTSFLKVYEEANLPVGFIFADWEIDGPLEWNQAYSASKRCRVCRDHLPQIDDFLAYQDALRRLRSRLQQLAYARPVLERFPNALVGNYAVYPHDGWRYWYDYFERYVPGQPALIDQKARYRHWADEFAATRYTFSMPVVYPWSWTWNWYDFEPGDYRWFYNGLLVASNAGRHTPSDVPIVAFVHWHTIDVGPTVEENASAESFTAPQQMSEQVYEELLWHMLLRGTDTFFLWCRKEEQTKEVRLLHSVWAAAQQYGEFLEKGVPVAFDVPTKPGVVVSGLRLGDRVLVRRTDFTDTDEAFPLRVGETTLLVNKNPGECKILMLVE